MGDSDIMGDGGDGRNEGGTPGPAFTYTAHPAVIAENNPNLAKITCKTPPRQLTATVRAVASSSSPASDSRTYRQTRPRPQHAPFAVSACVYLLLVASRLYPPALLRSTISCDRHIAHA